MHPSRWTNLQRFRFHCSKPKLEILPPLGRLAKFAFPFFYGFQVFATFQRALRRVAAYLHQSQKCHRRPKRIMGPFRRYDYSIRHPPDDGVAEAEMITLEGFWRRQPVDMEVLCGQAGDIGALSAKMRSLLSSRRKSPLAFDGASSGECGLRERARFVGPQFDEDKKKSFERADAFVLPSLSEGFPMVVLEAWSYGLPVLMTSFCNLPIGLKRGAALAMNPTPESIWGGIGMLSALSDADRSRMRKLGRALVSEMFTWDRVTVKVREMYDWALGGGPLPSSFDAGR